MKRLFATLSIALPFAAFCTTVSNVVVSTDTAAKTISVSYGIDTASIVTISLAKDGVKLAPSRFASLAESGNVKVAPGEHTATWRVGDDWPESRFAASSISATVTAWPVDRGPDYMAIDLVTPGTVSYYASLEDLPGGINSDLWRTTKMLFRKIPASGVKCRLGTATDKFGRRDNSEKLHWVSFTDDYYIGVFEVTQKQFLLIHGSNPSAFKSGDESVWGTRPVESVSFTFWDDRSYSSAAYIRDANWPPPEGKTGHEVWTDKAYLAKIRSHSGFGEELDLPTYSQWEYACRAGEPASVYTGSELTPESYSDTSNIEVDPVLEEVARYNKNSGGSGVATDDTTGRVGTARVGSYAPNAWGLYDMLGNVDEHCLDYWGTGIDDNTKETAYENFAGPSAPYIDRTSVSNYNVHVIAGGSWKSTDAEIAWRSAAHSAPAFNTSTSTGFRLCVTLKQEVDK